MVTVSWETVQAWKSVGIDMKLILVNGGYLVQLR